MIKKKATVNDVALEAGVSKASVSLVLNNKKCNIPKTTKDRIREAASKLNYTPNHIARSLVTKETKTIGVIIPNITNAFFSECVRNIQKELNVYGYDIFLCDSDEKLANDTKYINLLSNRDVDGLILTMSAESLTKDNKDKIHDLLKSKNIPFVLLDRHYGLEAPKVMVDNVNGGYEVTKYLIESGHRKIGVITGPLNLNSSRERLMGVVQALEEYGLTLNENDIFTGQYDMDTGRKGAFKLLPNVSAIFAFNDMQAFGVIDVAKELGVKIPEKVSLVGFDDTIYSTLFDLKLTTVRQPVVGLSHAVTDLILKCIDNPKITTEINLPTKLIIRDSVKIIGDVHE